MRQLFIATILAICASTCALADCDAEFKFMLEAMPKAGPYQYAIESADGAKNNDFKKVLQAEYIFGVASHIKMGTQEMLATTEGAWRMVDGKWQAMAEAETKSMQMGLKNPWYVHPENIKNLACLGPQDFEGKSYVTYGFDIEAFMGARTPQHLLVMKGANNLPAIIRAEKISNGDRMIARIAFDPAIKIEAPKP